MKTLKRISVSALALTMVFQLAGCNKENEQGTSTTTTTAPLHDGTYTANVSGYGGEMNVEVAINDGKISSVTPLSHHETLPVYNRAVKVLEDRFIEENKANIDTCTGATFTSLALKNAVNDCIEQAGGEKEEIKMDQREWGTDALVDMDTTTQLVIVGGGPAGLSAAIDAKEAGIEVIDLEKLDILGGNGKFDMLIFDMPNSKAQKDAGITYTKDEFIAKKEGKVTDSKERVEVWAQQACELDEWFRKQGANLDYVYDNTCHMAKQDAYAGEEILSALEEKVKELGVDVRTGTKVIDLIMEDGKASGVIVANKEGTYKIHSDAVIIASGGFAWNKELLKKYKPGSEKLQTSNQIGATGDMIPVLEGIDAKFEDMDNLKIFNPMLVRNRELTGARGDGFLFVNGEGKRFMAENEKDALKKGLTIKDQAKGVYYVYDTPLYESHYRVQKHNKLGYHEKADSIQELAEKIKVDPETLKKTIDDYNAAVRGEMEDPFREELPSREFDTEHPVYAARIESAVHMTKGGVLANEKAEVIGNDGKVIPGLYAAGEVTATSGIFKEAFIWGRVAGKEASAYIKEN